MSIRTSYHNIYC